MASYKDMIVFKKAFQNAMDIMMSKKFPKEETYSQTDQKKFTVCLCKLCRSIQKEKIPCSLFK